MIDRQRLALSGGIESVDIRYVVTLNSQPKRPGDLDLLTLKVVSESPVTWATSVPILVFLGFSVLDLGPMYATDRRQTSDKSIA